MTRAKVLRLLVDRPVTADYCTAPGGTVHLSMLGRVTLCGMTCTRGWRIGTRTRTAAEATCRRCARLFHVNRERDDRRRQATPPTWHRHPD